MLKNLIKQTKKQNAIKQPTAKQQIKQHQTFAMPQKERKTEANKDSSGRPPEKQPQISPKEQVGASIPVIGLSCAPSRALLSAMRAERGSRGGRGWSSGGGGEGRETD